MSELNTDMRIDPNSLTLTTDNTTLAVSLADMKAHLNIYDFDEDDELITAYINAASAYMEGPLGFGFGLMAKTYSVSLDRPTTTADVNLWPVIATTPAASFTPDGKISFSEPVTSFTVQIGHETSAEIPADIKQAIKMLVATWYKHREDLTSETINKLPIAVEAIIHKYKRY